MLAYVAPRGRILGRRGGFLIADEEAMGGPGMAVLRAEDTDGAAVHGGGIKLVRVWLSTVMVVAGAVGGGLGVW